MNSIWLNACQKLNISDELSIKWFNSIQLKTSQDSQRYFHNWNEHLIKKIEYLNDMTIHPAIIFSVFFQYYEFDVKKNCFDKNCKEFLKFSSEANIKDDNTIKRTLKLLGDDSIEETQYYNDDIQFLQDLDLIILGSTPEGYQKYSELLRKEYNHMDDETYCAMRRNILQTILKMPVIYSTKKFHEQFEETARRNITSELETLK